MQDQDKEALQLPSLAQSKGIQADRRVVTAAEVARHTSPSDCWVIVHGKVYDVTEYVPRHPGGAMIYVKAGGDCTQLFDSYHTKPYVRKILDKFEIAQLEECSPTTSYEQQGTDDTFYEELKASVNQYFRDSKLDPRFSAGMYIKTAIILLTLAASATYAFYFAWTLWAACAAGALLGFAMAEVGVSIQHDANHGAYSRNSLLCYTIGLTLDAVGASSFMWKQQHVVGHHAYTNVVGEDPDIRVKPDGSDVRRVMIQQPRGAHHAVQHLYLGLLYALLAFKSILVDDFSAVASGSIGSVKITSFATHEALAFWGGKLLFAAWFVAAPAAWSHWGLAQLMAIWACALAVCGWTLAFMFQVAHVSDEVEFLEKDANGRVPGSWAAQQIATCADFAHGSWFWTHVSGGLNYQAVHHLFPGIIHTHYPAIAPIVKEAAARQGVPYKVYPTFWAALAGHFKQLRNAGLNLTVPSLQHLG